MRPSRKPLFAAALVLVAITLVGFTWTSWPLPELRNNKPLAPALVLLTAQGEPFARRGAYQEAPVDVATLPRHVVAPVLAIEDRRFYAHSGVDLQGVARASLANLRAGEVVQGGSTITQQLAKISFTGDERSLRRKLQEALIALRLERELGKDEILSRYLSEAYFGDGVYGLRAAARHYFDKAPEELALNEAAMLAGVINKPSRLAPSKHLAAARARGDVVLAAMADAGWLTPAEAAATAPAKLNLGRPSLPVGSYFANWVSPGLKAAVGRGYGEVAVRTTLDGPLQARAEQIIRTALARQGKRDNVGQAALVAMRPSGEVVAMVGGRDYATSQFNRAVQARRQPGSAFKLFVYLAALRAGATPDSLVDDQPMKVADWSPRNFNGRHQGLLTLQQAFATSSNVAAVKVSEQVGREAVIRAARDLGVTGEIQPVPSLALGSASTSLLELTSAYAAVAAGTYPVVPVALPAPYGASATGALDPYAEQAPLLTLLRSAVEDGTGRAAALPIPAFGKTGTTQDHRDAWFVGFAGDLVVGVWVGNDDEAAMRNVTGGGLPAEIWRAFMQTALKDEIAQGEAAAAAQERMRALQPPPFFEAPRRGRPGWAERFEDMLGLDRWF